MFFGRSPVVEEEANNLIDHEVVITDSQNSQAALFVCNEINSEVKNLRQEVATLKSTIIDLQNKDKETRINTSRSSSKLPKGLSGIVHELYDGLTNKFEASQSFTSPHNKQVARDMMEQIYERHKDTFMAKDIKLAIHRYYESRRRIYNDAKPYRLAKVSENKQKAKRKGYRTRLYRRRDKATLTQEERALWRQLGEVYMTEESSDEENECVRCHHLPWASNDLQELKGVLDQRVKEKYVCAGRFMLKPRVESTPSLLPVPLNPVQWAVNSSSGRDYQSRRDHHPERDHQSGSGRDHRSGTDSRIDVGLTSSRSTALQSISSPSLRGLLSSVQQQTPHNGRRPLCSITNGSTPRRTVRQRQSRVAFTSGNVHRPIAMNKVAPQSEHFLSEPTINSSRTTENPDRRRMSSSQVLQNINDIDSDNSDY